jgi:large subunit ribosomal protein L10
MSTRTERSAVIDELEREFKDAKGIYVADNKKINVEKVTKLRADFRKNNVKFIVVKNTLAKEALKKVGKDAIAPYFKGATAVAVCHHEGTAPAKILRDFRNDNKDLLEIKIAYVDGTVFSGQDALKLADLPSRDVLLAQLLGTLKAPIGNFAGALNGLFTKLLGTIEAVKDKKAGEQ